MVVRPRFSLGFDCRTGRAVKVCTISNAKSDKHGRALIFEVLIGFYTSPANILYGLMNFRELVIRFALRNSYVSVAKMLLPSLSSEMHLEFAFFIMKYVVSNRKYASYLIVCELTAQLSQYALPSTAQECNVHRIGCAAAYIVLMKDLITTRNDPRKRLEVISMVRKLLPDTGDFKELDVEIRKSRVTLLAISMEECRIDRMQRRFDRTAEKISAQIEQHLNILETDLLPPLETFTLESWIQSSIPEQIALAEIVTSNGLREESFMQYFELFRSTPSSSIDFFRTNSIDLFTERQEILDFLVVDN